MILEKKYYFENVGQNPGTWPNFQIISKYFTIVENSLLGQKHEPYGKTVTQIDFTLFADYSS